MKIEPFPIEETAKGKMYRAGLTSLENDVRKLVLLGFARNGKAPEYSEIAKRLKISSLEVVLLTIEKLKVSDLLQMKGDAIIASYPFSSLRTRHKVIFADGHEVYALCATDALGVHFMLKQDITVLSDCPQCSGEIRVTLKNGSIHFCSPEEVVEFFGKRERSCCTAKTLCPYINFFCSRQHIEEWSKDNTENRTGEIYSLTDAAEYSKTIFGDFLE